MAKPLVQNKPDTTQVSMTSPNAVFDHFIVKVKERWDFAWKVVSYLEPISSVDVAAPAYPQAQFLYTYGNIAREDTASFNDFDPQDLIGQFVQIYGIKDNDPEVALWTGIFTEESFAIQAPNPGDKPQGDQTMIARGLVYLLDRRPITGAFCLQAPSPGSTPALTQLDVMPTFNQRSIYGITTEGNRTTNKTDITGWSGYDPDTDPNTLHVFSKDGAVWTFKDILDHIRVFFPAPPGPGPGPKFIPDPQVASMLDDKTDILNVRGLTLKQILDRMVQPRQGLGYAIRLSLKPGDTSELAMIRIFSLLGNKFVYEDVTVPANTEQITLDLKSPLDVEATIDINHNLKYDLIRVEGKNILVCFSASFADTTLEKGWADADETAFLAGSGDGSDPVKNDLMRNSDRYERVFRFFRVQHDTDWSFGDGEGQTILPQSRGNVYIDSAGKFFDEPQGADDRPGYFNFGRSLERQLPILQQDGDTPNAEPENLSMMVFVKNETDGKWMQLDRAEPNRASIQPVEREFGFRVVSSIPALMALNHWSSANSGQVEPVYDWETMIGTIAVRTDQPLRCLVPLTPNQDDPKTLYIRVPDAEMHILLRATITGVDDLGNLQRFTGNDQVVRDDGLKLRTIGALAAAWYKQERATINATFNHVEPAFQVGQYVKDATTATGRQPVGTVITKIRYDYRRRRTTITTDYFDIDAEGLSAFGRRAPGSV